MKTAATYAIDAGRRIARLGCDVAQMKSRFDEAAKEAARTVRKGWHAAEDFADDVAFAVKKQPLKSIGCTFGIAFGIGALAGWFGTRKS